MNKNLRKPIVCLSIAIFVFTFTNGQVSLLPGFYISNNGDTVNCTFEYRDSRTSPEKINIIVGNDKKTLVPGNCKSFSITNIGEFVAVNIAVHINPITGSDLPDDYSDSTILISAFTQVLVKGRYSLYELILPKRAYFLLQEEGKGFQELVYRVRVRDLTEEEDNQYKRVLYDILDREQLSTTHKTILGNTKYNAGSLTSLFIRINNGKATVTKKKGQSSIRLSLVAGLKANYFPSGAWGAYAKYVPIDPHIGFTGGLAIQYLVPGRFQRWGIGASLAIDGFKKTKIAYDSVFIKQSENFYYTNVSNDTITVQNRNIILDLYAFYILNPLSKTRFYVKAGLSSRSVLGNRELSSVSVRLKYWGVRNGNTPFSGGEARSNWKLIEQNDASFSALTGAGFYRGRHGLHIDYVFPTSVTDRVPISADPSAKRSIKIGSITLMYSFSMGKRA